MQVHGYGEIIWCREVIFENGKYDRLGRHPGIILLPTSEKEDNAYCLHMTSDKKRVTREEDKYVECKAAVKKGTYINIEHIIKRNNSMDSAIIDEMRESKFLELLKKFYDYQMDLSTPGREFLDIKYKVEVLIELLKINNELGIQNGRIRYEELSLYSSINDVKRVNRIYLAKLLLGNNSLKNQVNKICLNSDKDRMYVNKLLEIYGDLSELELDKVDIKNPNNQISSIYNDSKRNNYLLNTDVLFYDLIELFKVCGIDDKSINAMNKFMKYQEELEEKNRNERILEAERKIKQKLKIEERLKRKEEANKQKRKVQAISKAERRRAALVEKYGEFDWD